MNGATLIVLAIIALGAWIISQTPISQRARNVVWIVAAIMVALVLLRGAGVVRI